MPTNDISQRHTEIATALIDGRTVAASPAVSPDGARVAFVVSTTNLELNKDLTRIWIDDAPLTSGDKDRSPAWSPDGRFLAFASERADKKGETTLHVIPVDGPGETRTVCTMPDGIGDVAWSPDGETIAFTSRTQDERYTKDDDSWRSPRKVERFFSRMNGDGWVFDRPAHVYTVTADGTGTPRNLTPGEFQHEGGIAWTPDSQTLIASAQRHPEWDRNLAHDLYAIPVDADQHPDSIRCLTSHDGSYWQPAVSPDGSRVAFIGHEDPDTLVHNYAIGSIDVDADGAPHTDIVWGSKDLDRTFLCSVAFGPPVWENESTVLAIGEDRGDTHLYRVQFDDTPTEPVTGGPITVSDVSASNGTIVTIRSSSVAASELYVGEQQQTTFSRSLTPKLLTWEKFAAPCADGSDEIDAWIMRPADFDESRTYPVLLNVHGGPYTQYGENFFDEAQMQAAAGFVVVMGNPRGSSGRHEHWGRAIMGPKHPTHPGTGWGSVDVEDVLSIIDTALDRYAFCDRNRVGMLGGSYGGFMATWLAANHGDRFRGFCSERAVNNLVSEEWNADIGTHFRTEHGPLYIDDVEAYESRSPIKDIRNIDTPMLIIHSEEDWRCPIGQAEELWMGLKLLGRQVDFYRFPGENHELSRSGSAVHRVQRAEIILDWFHDTLAPE
ncbi:MAG: alpha/beta fold hydrolase [Ilumatobacter sp.]